MRHEQYITQLIEAGKFKSYLEIGIGTGVFFKSVQIESKQFCDPVENGIGSDEFFANCKDKFDLIFIDGLHHADQVERDILNSWKHLSAKGIILVHDICPKNEVMTLIPRRQAEWTGDVYKAWMSLARTYSHTLQIETITTVDYGLGKITKSKHKIEPFLNEELNYQDYETTNN